MLADVPGFVVAVVASAASVAGAVMTFIGLRSARQSDVRREQEGSKVPVYSAVDMESEVHKLRRLPRWRDIERDESGSVSVEAVVLGAGLCLLATGIYLFVR